MEYYQIHKAASLVPLPTKEEQEALTEDIRTNGQQVPISLYRGKIIDGRSRQNACIELMISVDAKELPNNMKLNEIESFVKSVNTRRNLTRVQKVMVALTEARKETNPNYSEFAKRWGISAPEMSNAKFIMEHRKEYIKILFDGKTITYVEAATGKTKTGTSLYPIRQAIQKEIDLLEKDGDLPEHKGSMFIARGFDQLRSAISFLPKEITNKDKHFMLNILANEHKALEYKKTK